MYEQEELEKRKRMHRAKIIVFVSVILVVGSLLFITWERAANPNAAWPKIVWALVIVAVLVYALAVIAKRILKSID